MNLRKWLVGVSVVGITVASIGEARPVSATSGMEGVNQAERTLDIHAEMGALLSALRPEAPVDDDYKSAVL